MSQWKESDTMSNPTLSPGVPVPEATSGVIEAIPVSIFRGSSQDTAPTRRRRAKMSPQPDYLVHWDVYEKQRPNGRTDKYYRHKELRFLCRSLKEVDAYETSGMRRTRANKPKGNKEEIMSHELPSVMLLPWKEEAEAADEKIKNMNTSDPSTSTVASTSTSTAPKVKRERKKRVEKIENSFNWNDLSGLKLLQVPITYVKEFKDHEAVPEV